MTADIPTPTTARQAASVGVAVRRAILDMYGETRNNCREAAVILMRLFPDAVLYAGTYPGDYEEGGYHYVAAVGRYLIDVTADQFGGGRVDVVRTDSTGGTPYTWFRPSSAGFRDATDGVAGAGHVVDFYFAARRPQSATI